MKIYQNRKKRGVTSKLYGGKKKKNYEQKKKIFAERFFASLENCTGNISDGLM